MTICGVSADGLGANTCEKTLSCGRQTAPITLLGHTVHLLMSIPSSTADNSNRR